MKTKFLGAALLASAAAISTINHANAASLDVSTPCSPTEVTLGGSNASSCYGYFGDLANSNPETQTAALNAAATLSGTADDFLLINRVDGGDLSGVFDGLLLSMTGVQQGVTVDTWMFSWQDTNGIDPANLPYFIDLVFSFKGGSGQSDAGVAFYLFDDFKLTNDPYQTTGTFNMLVKAGLSNNGLWARPGEEKTTPICGSPDTFPCEEVPEPNVLALLGIGLLALGFQPVRKVCRA